MAKRAAILNIGTELLVGHVLNTHAQYLTKWLNHMGFGVHYHMSLGDNASRIEAGLAFLSNEADLILVTGGLGPTQDDITRQVVANFLGVALERRPEVVLGIDEAFKKWDRLPTQNNYLQADFPVGSQVLENPKGTAPGFVIEKNGLTIACLPGPPIEVRAVVEGALATYLAGNDQTLFSRYITLHGIGESALDERIADLFEAQQDPTIGIYAQDGLITLRLSTLKEDQARADQVFDPLEAAISSRLAQYLVSTSGENVAEALIASLRKSNLTLAVAESCTGGLIGKYLTDVSGASDVFLGGVISYSNPAKMDLLGVSQDHLETDGAVSQRVCGEMAEGALKALKSDVAIAVTGIAGPNGATEGKPVGTVYIGLAFRNGQTLVNRYQFPGDRGRVRLHTALTAMKTLIDHFRVGP